MTAARVGSALAFRTGIIPGPSFSVLEYRMISAAADGSFWATDGRRLTAYSPAQGQMVNVAQIAVPSTTYGANRIAAVNAGLAYVLNTVNGAAVVSAWRRGGALTHLPALPGGEEPAGVAAASDQTVWVIGSKGNLYAYDAAGVRTAVPAPPGGSVTQVSLGHARFALALATRGTQVKLLRFDGAAWSEVLTLPAGAVAWIGACGDEAYWMLAPGSLTLTLPAGKRIPFPLPAGIPMLGPATAGSRYGCYCGGLNVVNPFGVGCAAYGVLDEPAETWPVWSPGEALAYDAICDELLIGDPAGVRSQYGSLAAPIGEWYTDVAGMKRPDNVLAADWDKVQATIKTELKAVDSIRAFFLNLRLLNIQIHLLLSNTRAKVTTMVGLPAETRDQPRRPVDVVLGKLLDKIFAAAIEKAPPEVGKAINLANALTTYAADAVAKKLGGADSSTQLQIACADLAGTLSDIQQQMVALTDGTQKTLLADVRKLAACGTAIASGLWFLPADFDFKVLAGIGAAVELQMYQTLMPAKWQILRFQTLFMAGGGLPLRPYPTHAPAYSLMWKKVMDKSANMLCWWWVCADLAAAKAEKDSEGPFPNRATVQALMRLTDPLDFFTGAKGWRLAVKTQSGYTPPPDGVPWQPWVDGDSPLQ